jgi:hypothetical protein
VEKIGIRGLQYFATHGGGGTLVLATNWMANAPESGIPASAPLQVMTVPLAAYLPGDGSTALKTVSWTSLVPPRPEVSIGDIEIFTATPEATQDSADLDPRKAPPVFVAVYENTIAGGIDGVQMAVNHRGSAVQARMLLVPVSTAAHASEAVRDSNKASIAVANKADAGRLFAAAVDPALPAGSMYVPVPLDSCQITSKPIFVETRTASAQTSTRAPFPTRNTGYFLKLAFTVSTATEADEDFEVSLSIPPRSQSGLVSGTVLSTSKDDVAVPANAFRPLYSGRDYECYTIHAPSCPSRYSSAAAGVCRVPITVVHRADLGIDVDAVMETSEQLCSSVASVLAMETEEAGDAFSAPRDAFENPVFATIEDHLRRACPQGMDRWPEELGLRTAGGHAGATGAGAPASFSESLFSVARAAADFVVRAGTTFVPPFTHRQELPCFPPAAPPSQWQNNNPCIMQMYGAYGHSMDVTFTGQRLPLLSRGWVTAFPHVRGGGEGGKEWYFEGRQREKWNTFHDAVSSALTLIATGLTRPSLLLSRTESAGALIGGYLVNLYPDLLRGHILRMPFLDPWTVMQDPSLPLSLPERMEWGNPSPVVTAEGAAKPYAWASDHIFAYSPLQNIPSAEGLLVQRGGRLAVQAVPGLYAVASDGDIRAPKEQAIEFIRRNRQMRADAVSALYRTRSDLRPERRPLQSRAEAVSQLPPALCRVLEAAGHHGHSTRQGTVDDLGAETAFAMHMVGASASALDRMDRMHGLFSPIAGAIDQTQIAS